MIKKICFTLTILFIGFSTYSQENAKDTAAIQILDKMSTLFGELNSVGFKTQVSKDVTFANNFFIKEFTSSQVKITGPNKFAIKIVGEQKEDKYSYNGSQVAYYSFTNNIYTIADAPDNLIETFDWLYNDFGIEVTSADVLYPSFSKDIVSDMDYIQFLGQTTVNGQRVFHIGCSNDSVTIQLWISNDLYFLPVKTLITYLGDPYAYQHEVDFSDWEFNQTYPNSIFDFTPPPGARQITWLNQK
jgi:hypothetical protein